MTIASGQEPLRMLDLPIDFSADQLEDILRQAYKMGVADINLQTNDFIFGHAEGTWVRLTERRLQATEMERALSFIYPGGASGYAKLLDGSPIDFAVRVGREQGMIDHMLRFRSNGTGGYVNGANSGVALTLRTIPAQPPSFGDLGLPQEIADNFFIRDGLVSVVGTTGSGKSTLLAASIRSRLEGDRPVKILLYEDTIEYVYDGLSEGRMPEPFHVHVGSNITNYGEAGRNAMRRKGDVIIIGESRDRESMAACLEMSLSGHATYNTMHCDTPAQFFARAVNFFPEDGQPAKANELLDSVKSVVAQKLYRARDGRKHAVQSWLVNDRECYAKLESERHQSRGRLIREIVQERESSFEHEALPALKDRLMTVETFRSVTGMTVSETESCLARHNVRDVATDEYRVPGV